MLFLQLLLQRFNLGAIMAITANNTTLTFNDATTQTTSAVTAVNVSTGISSTGGKTPTLTNSGVTSIVAGTGISISGGTGAVTITNSSPGAVTGASVQIFVANGTFTIPSGISRLKVTVCGGGGTGGAGNTCLGASGGGGGGAGVAIKWLTGLTPGNTITVTRGAAGGSSSIASGTQSITTVTGGGGGTGSVPTVCGNAGNLGTAGTATNGDINLASRNYSTVEVSTGGAAGSFGGPNNSFARLAPGTGFLGGSPGMTSTTASVKAATGYGNGGGGGAPSGTVGGVATGGIVIFEW
jgi:hypothetical protein